MNVPVTARLEEPDVDARDFLWFRVGRAVLTVGLWIWFLLSVGLAALAPLLNLSRLVNVTILAVAFVSALATGWCLRYLGWAVLSAALWTWLVVGVGVTTLSILLDPTTRGLLESQSGRHLSRLFYLEELSG